MNSLPSGVHDAIEALKDLPGIGSRSAERLVLTMLRSHSRLDEKIGKSLTNMRTKVAECRNCCHLTEKNEENDTTMPLCHFCQHHGRQKKLLCVVESPMDVLALERTESFKGVYHVLHGVMNPMERIRPEDIRLIPLLERLEKNEEQIDEIIFALPANTEGEATSLYIQQKIKPFYKGTVTHLARGIPSGSVLDFVDAGTLQRALLERR